MGQAEVIEFLTKYRKSPKYKIKRWLTTREIHERLRKKGDIQLSSVTTSLKKLRETEMIRYKELPTKSRRFVLHYRAK